MGLHLAPRHIDDLDQHCKNCWPEEACALLVGRHEEGGDRFVHRVVLSQNVALEKTRFFEIDPGVRIKLERELRNGDDEIVGVFHSHPDGPAFPSKSDQRMVVEKQFVWLIAAVTNTGITDIGAFDFSKNDNFVTVPVITLER